MAVKKSLGARLTELLGFKGDNEEFFEELEDRLTASDIGARTAMELVTALRSGRYGTRLREPAILLEALKEQLLPVLKETALEPVPGELNVRLVLGVNGVGKTTTIAKMASHYSSHYDLSGVVLAAADTFRAAAVEQLSLHGERLGLRVVKQGSGADPAAVVYDAISSASARGDDLVIADTAGRMHNRANLVAELGKIDKIIRRACDESRYRKILVIDGTTGQNGLRQAETFHEAVGLDAVVLAKYDSSSRGGVLVPIAQELGIPCAFLGNGEGYGDLIPFDSERYIADLLEQR
ncbi:MAG: signal recognition particle-docking protein FtsY [Spirochaetaceae bacterium]|nr:MAG: signal recognition particle-docking protein FtsY [Spirochaetaceae bacterium]